jgi:cell division transport system permease protein
MFKIKKRESFMGVATGTRQYDLPLNKDKGNNFLMLLMALMTLMGVFALTGSFALSAMKERWTSGLENKATIEIPAQDGNGILLSADSIDVIANKIIERLQTRADVKSVERLSTAEISSLISPWLGSGEAALSQFPLPALITVHFQDGANPSDIEKSIKNYAPTAHLDKHESWLSDVLEFTGSLKAAAIAVTLIVLFTTVVSVAGAVQSRMAVYREELELLHIMGAADKYITNQIPRYMFFICLRGAIIGTAIGILLVLIGMWITGQSGVNLIPDFKISGSQWLILVILPIFVALIGMGTARHTTLRTLHEMA